MLTSFFFPMFSPSEPLAKAIEAAYIQSGMRGYEYQFRDYGSDKAKSYAKGFGLDKELGVILFAASIYREKTLTFKYHGKRIYLMKDTVLVEVPF
jgi:hypothetical protein